MAYQRKKGYQAKIFLFDVQTDDVKMKRKIFVKFPGIISLVVIGLLLFWSIEGLYGDQSPGKEENISLP